MLALPALLVAINDRSVQVNAGNPWLAEQPVERHIRTQTVILVFHPSTRQSIRIRLRIPAAKVPRKTYGQSQRLVSQSPVIKKIGVGQ